jgi:hypothetical protein
MIKHFENECKDFQTVQESGGFAKERNLKERFIFCSFTTALFHRGRVGFLRKQESDASPMKQWIIGGVRTPYASS